MHEGGGRWVGSNKLVELKRKKKKKVPQKSADAAPLGGRSQRSSSVTRARNFYCVQNLLGTDFVNPSF